MGGSGSKQAQLDKFGQLLSSQEKEALNTCFLAIAGAQEAEGFGEEKLQAYLGGPHFSLPKEIISGLFRALCGDNQHDGGSKRNQVTFANFILHTSWLLKGSSSQRSELLQTICGEAALTVERFESVLQSFSTAILTSECAKVTYPHILDWSFQADSSRYLVSHLVESLREKKTSENQPDLETWLRSCSLAQRMFDVGFALCFYREALSSTPTPPDIKNYLGIETSSAGASTERFLVPRKVQHPLIRESFESSLLDQSSLMLLTSYLPFEVRGTLYPLFSSVHHGESFSTFCKQLVDKGPTMVVVRDNGGHVFGGFAATSWQFNPQFTGNANCFLFRLSPEMGVFVPTGYNENYMYLQQSAQTLPNGLGMGGQMEYFGLWLSADFGSGHSKAKPRCTTYASPMLSASEEFQIDVLEVWGVGTPAVPEKEGASSQPSILDRDKTATAILEMAGKTRHSEGLREPEEGEEGT